MSTKTVQRGVVDELPVAGGNCMSYSAGPEQAELIFANLLRERAPVVLANECSKVDAAKVAMRVFRETGVLYRVLQHADVRDPRRSLVVAWRPDSVRVDRPKYFVGSEATSEGGNIDRREVLRIRVTVLRSARRRVDGKRGRLWRTTMSVSHRPPPRAPIAAAKWLDRFRGMAAGKWRFSDYNDRGLVIARFLLRPARFVGVLGLVGPPGAGNRMGRAVSLDLGGDHPGIRVTIRRWSRGTAARLADTGTGSA